MVRTELGSESESMSSRLRAYMAISLSIRRGGPGPLDAGPRVDR
jgi:hypothetical protein